MSGNERMAENVFNRNTDSLYNLANVILYEYTIVTSDMLNKGIKTSSNRLNSN